MLNHWARLLRALSSVALVLCLTGCSTVVSYDGSRGIDTDVSDTEYGGAALAGRGDTRGGSSGETADSKTRGTSDSEIGSTGDDGTGRTLDGKSGETGDNPPTGNDAQLVDNDLPSSTPCGVWNPSSIRMRNTGTTTWTREAGYMLGAVGNSDPLYPTDIRVLLPEGVEVPPNGEWEFEFSILGPAEPGFYLSDWQMIHEGVEWFGEVVSRDVEVTCQNAGDGTGNGSELVDNDLPNSIACGVESNAAVRMRNTGTTTWTREAGYKLGAYGDSDPFYLVDTRVWLPEGVEVPPNGEWSFEFSLLGTDEPGIYTTDWQMIQEGAEWFGEVVSRDVEVDCPDPGEGGDSSQTDCTQNDKDAVLASATYVRDTFSEFFDIEDMEAHAKRLKAYEMMTVVINDLRGKGINASRCVANPGLPENDPFLWCSDALVCGSPGMGTTIDIYLSWSFPADPQILVTGTGSTGVVTSDLVPLP